MEKRAAPALRLLPNRLDDERELCVRSLPASQQGGWPEEPPTCEEPGPARRKDSAGSPAGHHGDYNLGHEPDQALDLKDVEATGSGWIYRLGCLSIGVAVAVIPANPLVSSRAEGPATVTRRRSVSC